jgi:hypothetical protein
MRLPVVLGLATLVACSGKKDAEPTAQPAVVVHVQSDAGVVTVITPVDSTERHLDEDGTERPASHAPHGSRQGRPIDITLRSSPPGAQVAVDGAVLGNTPAFWSGMADGKEHEFVFSMRGYAIARYRFVPVSSGVIHGRLDPIHEETDAGVPMPPPEVVPPRSPAAPPVTPPSPPPTIVTPDAAAPVPAPGSGESPVGPQP